MARSRSLPRVAHLELRQLGFDSLRAVSGAPAPLILCHSLPSISWSHYFEGGIFLFPLFSAIEEVVSQVRWCAPIIPSYLRG